jgi:hypothetical protein
MNKTIRELEALFFASSDNNEKWEILQRIYAIQNEEMAEYINRTKEALR